MQLGGMCSNPDDRCPHLVDLEREAPLGMGGKRVIEAERGESICRRSGFELGHSLFGARRPSTTVNHDDRRKCGGRSRSAASLRQILVQQNGLSVLLGVGKIPRLASGKRRRCAVWRRRFAGSRRPACGRHQCNAGGRENSRSHPSARGIFHPARIGRRLAPALCPDV